MEALHVHVRAQLEVRIWGSESKRIEPTWSCVPNFFLPVVYFCLSIAYMTHKLLLQSSYHSNCIAITPTPFSTGCIACSPFALLCLLALLMRYLHNQSKQFQYEKIRFQEKPSQYLDQTFFLAFLPTAPPAATCLAAFLASLFFLPFAIQNSRRFWFCCSLR